VTLFFGISYKWTTEGGPGFTSKLLEVTHLLCFLFSQFFVAEESGVKRFRSPLQLATALSFSG